LYFPVRWNGDLHGHHWGASGVTKKETTLADGSRESTYSYDSKIESRDVIRFDEKGREVGSRHYNCDAHLTSEDSTLFNSDDETTIWKIYDESGQVALHEETRIAADNTRFDRWSYAPDGHLAWHLALNANGELLSSWYEVGYKPKQSSSNSLGICRRRLCVSYKFDEKGSGRLEKMVQHTPGDGNLEPDSDEHYNFEGVLDEKTEIKYVRDDRGN
jgi:hypothetical protein